MSQMTMKQAISDALREEMQRDEKVFLIGEDIGCYGGCFGVTAGLQKEFGHERVMETPITEHAFTDIAVGAAMAGYRPVVELMYSDFAPMAMDAIVNQAAKQRFMLGGQVTVPMVIRMPFGSGTGAAAQHSQSLETWFCHVPGLQVIAPATAYDAKGLLKSAIRSDNPVLFFEHKLAYPVAGEVPEEEYLLPIGKADIKRPGRDITIVSYSFMLHRALQTAHMLEKEGIDAEVLDLRTLSPLDTGAIIASAAKTGRVLVAHESVRNYGAGAEIAAVVAGSEAFHQLKKPIARLGGLFMPIPFARDLEAQAVPQTEDIYIKAKELLK